MAELVDYNSDLFFYNSEICYNEPDCEIIIEPEREKSLGSNSSSTGYIAYPYFTPEQINNWLKTFEKKRIKIQIKVKVNEKEHISLTQILEKDNLNDMKNLTFKIKEITETIIAPEKKFVVKFNKVTKIN
jgi:hypothetical protein